MGVCNPLAEPETAGAPHPLIDRAPGARLTPANPLLIPQRMPLAIPDFMSVW